MQCFDPVFWNDGLLGSSCISAPTAQTDSAKLARQLGSPDRLPVQWQTPHGLPQAPARPPSCEGRILHKGRERMTRAARCFSLEGPASQYKPPDMLRSDPLTLSTRSPHLPPHLGHPFPNSSSHPRTALPSPSSQFPHISKWRPECQAFSLGRASWRAGLRAAASWPNQ